MPLSTALCPHLNNPLHGSVVVTGYSIGDIAHYSCSPGYDLVGESAQICTNDSSWTDKLPVCESKLLEFCMHSFKNAVPNLQLNAKN